MKHNRSLRNVLLTRKFHLTFFGLWIVIALLLVVFANLFLYLWIQEYFQGYHSVISESQALYIRFRSVLVQALAVEALLLAVGIFALARLTAHRIAGPYIRMRQVFDAIREGKHDARLTFREYDQLDDVASSFNAMMDALTKQAGKR